MTTETPTSSEIEIATTSKYVALSLILIFGIGLLLSWVGAFWAHAGDETPWLEVFKSGLLLLGGGLTTVTGYYFGSRGAQAAESNAVQARKDAKEAAAQLAETREREMMEAQAPSWDENALEDPDESVDEEDDENEY